MITCPQCGGQNIPGMAYCEHCGSPLAQAPAAAPPTISAAPAQGSTAGGGSSGASAPVIVTAVDPAGIAVPQPVMPVDQPAAGPDLNVPAPATNANVVAAEPADAPSTGPYTPPSPASGGAASTGSPVDRQAPVPPAPAPVAAPAAGVLTITFPSGQTYTMQSDEVNVGRADVAQNWYPELDVIPFGGGAPDLGVSRHHARISRQDGTFTVTDMGSTNGTYVNGHVATYNVPVPVNNGDTLSFGALNTQVSVT